MAYIEREKVVELIKNYGKGAIEDGLKTLDPVDDIVLLEKGVDLIPAADVVEVRHGYWVDGKCGHYKICSECKQIADFDFDYCPNCGAKMDGKDGE